MALVKQGNALLLKNGAIATGQGCCCGGGACCTCTSNEQTWGGGVVDFPQAIWELGGAFCTPAERDAATAAIIQATQEQLTGPAKAALAAGGWTCIGSTESVFTDSGPNTEGDFLWNPECGPGVEVFGTTPDYWAVGAFCCGTIDTEGEPIDLGFGGHQTYPCVGPYTYTCVDNVPAEQCCGIHHPGKTCAEEPCGDCGVTCSGVPCSELGDPACGPDCDCNFMQGECVCPTCLKCEKYFPKSELPEGQGCPDGFEEEGEGEQARCMQRTLGPRLWTEQGGTWCSENCDLGGIIEVGGVEIFYQGVCVDAQCPNPLP